MAINRENVLSSLNSSITPLSSNETFTGPGEKVFVHDSAVVSVYSDQDGTLYIEQSPDGINWDISSPYSISAGIEETNSLIITRQFLRVRYVNGASGQGFFRLQTLFGTFANISIDTYVGAPGLTNAQLRASPVAVETELEQPLTDDELRAAPVAVDTGLLQGLTNFELRSSPIDVQGPLTDSELRASAVDVDTGLNPLTDAQLRASPVPVDTGLLQGLTDAELRATPIQVDTQLVQGLTDTQLRASPVPVSGTVTANAGTNLNTSALNLESTQTAISGKVDTTNTNLSSIASLLTTIRDNADAVEALLTAIGSNTDGVEALIGTTNTTLSTSNSLLTSIRDNADGVEALLTTSNSLLTDIETATDDIETLIGTTNTNTSNINTTLGSTNTLLTTIRDNSDQLEGYLDNVETLLTNIGNNTDTLESLLDTVETLLAKEGPYSTLSFGNVTVGTSEVEAKVGAGRLSNRVFLRIFNFSNTVVFWGKTGVLTNTGEPIQRNGFIDIPASDSLGIFLIATTASNTVIVQEWAP